MNHLRRLLHDEEAIATVETALIVVIVCIAAYLAYLGLGALVADCAGNGADAFADDGR